MSKNFVSVIVLHLLLCSYVFAADSETKPNPKNDSEPSAKSSTEPKKDKEKFAAPLSEQESARTHSSWRPNIFGGHGEGSRLLPVRPMQYEQPTHLPMNRLPILPQLPHMVSNKFPMMKPIMSHFRPPSIPHPVAPVPVAPIPVAPVEPVAQFKPTPPIYSPVHFPPTISKPTVPLAEKPTFVISQQVIHKPVVTEKIEIIRRPVISEIVEVVHKPILSEVQQVIKHPTYIQHVVKKPTINEVHNEVVGSPLHLPGQHYEVHDKPTYVQAVTNEVIQIPHQQIETGYKPSYGIESLYKPSYGIESGYKPSYGIESGYKPSYGIESLFKPSYGIESAYKPSYGIESEYKPSYGFESGYKPSYGIESGYKPSYGIESGYKPSYGIESGYKPTYSGYKPSYGLGGVGGGIVGIGSSQGYGSGYGSSSGVEYGYGSTSGYGGEYGGAEQTWVVPAPGCKSGECGPIAVENAISPANENLQSTNLPYAWYPSPSRDLYERNNGDELYEQVGIPLNPNYVYLTQMQPEEQLPITDQQSTLIKDFLAKNPSFKIALDDFTRKLTQDTKSRTESEKLPSGRSSIDDGESISPEDDPEKEKIKPVMNFINSADGPTLDRLEAEVKARGAALAKSAPTKTEDVPTAKVSTP